MGFAGSAGAQGLPPRAGALCAALLAEPNFVRLGHLRPPTAAPVVSFVAGQLLPRVTEGRLEVRQRSRAIVGREDITEYLGATLTLARQLDRAMNVDPEFWTPARRKDALISAVLPTLLAGAAATELVGLALDPAQIIYWGAPFAATFGATAWVIRDHLRTTWNYLGALRGPAGRARVVAGEPGRAGEAIAFLENTLRDVREGRAVNHPGPAFGAFVNAALARLLIDAPGVDAHPTEITNHRELIERELSKPAEDQKLMLVQLDLEVIEAEVKLLITANLIDVDGLPPRRSPPRRPRREVEESYAGQPALVPIPIRQ